jgi:hypothetical protein
VLQSPPLPPISPPLPPSSLLPPGYSPPLPPYTLPPFSAPLQISKTPKTTNTCIDGKNNDGNNGNSKSIQDIHEELRKDFKRKTNESIELKRKIDKRNEPRLGRYVIFWMYILLGCSVV